ncbi:MAG: ketoacyl-ACP synthase III [Elusimicrobia bacterium]|nr:ketoacyl-ACP synthase III [Elusimicrobiota bacterium]
MGVKILSTGSYFPEKVLTNADLAKIVDTSDEWIITRTGIKERRVAAQNQATSDLALEASKDALKKAGLSPQDIELIIVATVTPDMMFPSTACMLQTKLGASKAAAFDLLAACTGFIYALSTAKAFIESGMYKNVLLVGAETLTKITDWTDRNTCVLFGDGAGAMVLAAAEGESAVLSTYLGADGSYADLLNLPAGGSLTPASAETVNNKMHTIKMQGKEVFKVAVTKMFEAAEIGLERAGLKPDDVALFIPHQANMRIIEAVAKKLNMPLERIGINLQKTGNVSAATTITALDEAIKTGRLKTGDIVELIAFGGGFTWGSAVIKL